MSAFCAACCALVLCFYCTNNPIENKKPIVFTVSGDSLVTARDTLVLRFSAAGAAGQGVRYVWFVDSPLRPDTLDDSVLIHLFSIADTGRRLVVVQAIDGSGNRSAPDTFSVRVVYRCPAARIAGDTVTAVGAYSFRLSGTGGDSPLDRFVWYIDDSSRSHATPDTIVTLALKRADTGGHAVVARAVNTDGAVSPPCSLWVRVSNKNPFFKPLPDTSVKINDSLRVRFSARDSVSPVVSFRYFVDSPSRPAVTTDSSVVFVWSPSDTGRHLLVVTAVCLDSARSLPDSSFITVTCRHPVCTLRRDTAAGVNDTVAFSAQAGDADGTVDHFLWSIDGMGTSWLITKTGSLRWAFGGSADAVHTIRAVAVDNDGLLSAPDSILVRVTVRRPLVRLSPHDTTLYAGRPLRLTATASAVDSAHSVVRFRWGIDGRTAAGPDTLTVQWAVSGGGKHLVTCSAIDNDSIASLPDSCTVMVLPGYPQIVAMRDTTLSSLDSLLVTCRASDPNGTIAKYLWDFSGTAWDDSTSAPDHRLKYTGRKTQQVLVACRDNDGLIAVDTTVVTWNRPPDSIAVNRPQPDDTVLFTCVAPRCTVSFSWNAPDPDNDSVSFAFSWGPAPDSLSTFYEGKNRGVRVAAARPGFWYWRIAARDSWGNSIARQGKVVAIREYRICFIGHSIVVGVGGDGQNGGFRGGVCDSLRKTVRDFERLKVVGPVATGFMSSRPVADDSGLAISATTAREIWLILSNTAKNLVADLWVLMIGVNDNFSPIENGYTNFLIDTMIARNPAGRVYVINSPPLPDNYYLANYYLPSFNQGLVDSAAVHTGKGAHVFIVNAYAILGNNGKYDSTWFSDDLHPNQTGYNKLGNLIFSTMKTSNPPALP